MPDTKRASDAEFWEKVRQARQMSGEEKILAGLRMFEAECKRWEDAVRGFMPQADEATVQAIIKNVIAWRMRAETRPCQIFTT
jgi:hypothetical protein